MADRICFQWFFPDMIPYPEKYGRHHRHCSGARHCRGGPSQRPGGGARVNSPGFLQAFGKAVCVLFVLLLAIPPPPARGDDVYDLESIINRALEANRSMIAAHDDMQRAGLRLEGAESEFELKIYPAGSIGISGGDERDAGTEFRLGVGLEKKMRHGAEIGVEPLVQKTDDQYQSRANLRIVQPLLRGAGRDYAMSGVYSARFGERTARRSRDQREIETVVGAVRHGYEVVRQRELLRLREESHQRLEDLAKATAIKERMGIVDAMDLYRVRIQRNQAGEELDRSRELYDEALDSLKIFLALPLDADIGVFLPLDFDRIDPDEREMIRIALNNRVELEQIRDARAEAGRLSEKARNDILPELDIRLSLRREGEPSSGFPGSAPDSTTWGISLGSTTDFRRTAQRAVYEESLINIRQVSRRLRIARDEIAAQVKREIRNLERQDQAIANQEEQIRQARGQLELARVKFEHGMADNFDLIEAEISLRRAETLLLTAVIEYMIGQYRLRAAIGTLVHHR